MKKLMILAAVALVAAASQAATFKWSATGVQNAAGTGTYSGTATLFAYADGSLPTTAVQVDTATMTDGKIAAKTFSNDALAVGTKYYFYYTMSDGKNDFTSTEKFATGQKSSTPTLGFGSGGSWAKEPEPTPEPTSAMLMLLGVAGLALKRKQK